MEIIYYLKFAAVLLLLAIASFEDIRTRNIPNRLILYGVAGGIISALPYFTVSEGFDVLLGFLAGGGIFLAVSCISRGGIGMGDVKLMACTGLYLGLGRTLGSIVLSIIFCGVFGAVLLFIKGFDKKAAVPFAPFILIGVLASFIQSAIG